MMTDKRRGTARRFRRTSMRKLLNGLYIISGVLAALFLVLIAVVVLAQIIGRFFGFIVPSATEIAGFSVATSAFLALAPTLQHGAHIRVTLILEQLPQRIHRWVEVWCLGAALVLSLYYTRWVINLFVNSMRFGDVSPGLLAIPLWIPQLGMAIGLAIFSIALLDNLVIVLFTNREPAYRAGEQAGTAEDSI
ncbi:MAG TPA: TRAP transporter small permease [Salinisphaeraceae bacterium]|nr:TRAP transporter small permease [Salinisphaeraceae bacterium]